MRIIKIGVGQLQANCFLAADEKNGEGIIIDPGDDADFIIQKIQEEKIKPKMIVATHGHFDHIMAVNELKLAFKIPFLLSRKDLFLVKKIRASAKHFGKIDPGPPPQVDGFLKKGDRLVFGKEILKVLETPGHTPGGISLYSEKDKIIFTGDTLFALGGIGRTDYSYGNAQFLKKSLKRILDLPGETIVYTGHGEETRLEKEKSYHQVMR